MIVFQSSRLGFRIVENAFNLFAPRDIKIVRRGAKRSRCAVRKDRDARCEKIALCGAKRSRCAVRKDLAAWCEKIARREKITWREKVRNCVLISEN